MATYQFGVVSSGGTYGLLQEIGTTRSNKQGEAFDENGEVKDYTDHDHRDECNCKFKHDTDSAAPAPGDDIECKSENYHINEVTETEFNKEYRELTFKGIRYPKNDLPA